MSISNIFLIIISGLGVAHGLFLAIFLWTYKKGNNNANKILSLLLIVLSFRIGKSVFLEFVEHLDVKIIFIGLATMMAIGPLYYLYAKSIIDKDFQFKKRYLFHFIPSLIGIGFGAWLKEEGLTTIPKVVFLVIFLFYYAHYLVYLFIGFFKAKNARDKALDPKSYIFLRLMFFGLLVIWVAYMLNLFDDIIPYIYGPVLYSLVTYVISFIVIKNDYINGTGQSKYKSTPIAEEQIDHLFDKVLKLVIDEKQFKNPDLSLKVLCDRLNISTQILSLVINKRNKTNFNTFINQYRIEESINIFQNEKFQHYTIAAIAFDVGFNSISSFNAAFKKQTGKTPLAFRNALIK